MCVQKLLDYKGQGILQTSQLCAFLDCTTGALKKLGPRIVGRGFSRDKKTGAKRPPLRRFTRSKYSPFVAAPFSNAIRHFTFAPAGISSANVHNTAFPSGP